MSTVGLNLHGQIRLTLNNAKPDDARAVMRAIGACEDSSVGRPDIEIRFAQKSSAPDVWQQLGEEALHSDGRFAIKSPSSKSPIEIEIPTCDNSEQPFRLTYPSGIRRRFPLLRSMINAKCVDKQLLGVHATAFTFADHGYLVCGWPRGGKTGTLLAYLLQGAQYLAAEWVYVSHQGQMMHGVPEPIRLRDWHLRSGGSQLSKPCLGDRMRLVGCRVAALGMDRLSRLLANAIPSGGKSLRKLADAVDRRRYIDRSAEDWLGQHLRPRAAPLNTILLAGTHDAPDIRVRMLNAKDAKRRLTALQDDDLSDLTRVYRCWGYAMSDPSEWLAAFEKKRSRLFDQFLQDKEVYTVDHPHNVSLDDLFQVIESSVGETCLQSR